MFTEISTALVSLKAATSILKGFNDLQLDVAVKEKTSELFDIIISLQTNLLSMQSEYGKLLKSKDDLEKELETTKAKVLEKDNYILIELSTGVFVYTLKKVINPEEPKYYLCQNCFDTKNQKSILQRKYTHHNDLICNSCNTTFRIADSNEDNSQRIVFRP